VRLSQWSTARKSELPSKPLASKAAERFKSS
jgi:hypothetical protein